MNTDTIKKEDLYDPDYEEAYDEGYQSYNGPLSLDIANPYEGNENGYDKAFAEGLEDAAREAGDIDPTIRNGRYVVLDDDFKNKNVKEIVAQLNDVFDRCVRRFGYTSPVKVWPSTELRNAINSLKAENESAIEDLDNAADEFASSPDEDVASYAEEIWDIIAPLRQFNESKKSSNNEAVDKLLDREQKMNRKVSMREDDPLYGYGKEDFVESKKLNKKVLKEDADYDSLLNALAASLSSAGIDYQIESGRLYYINNSDKVKELAKRVCDKFNNSAKPVFSDPNSSKFYQFVTFTPNGAPKAGEGSDKLTDYQKSVIEDLAKSDYEIGHPFTPEDAYEWFSSGEEEDIPVDLAQKATDYYFEAFDQAREDDNSNFNEYE